MPLKPFAATPLLLTLAALIAPACADEPTRPEIEQLTAARGELTRGESTTLTWLVTGATWIQLREEGGVLLLASEVGAESASGSLPLSPRTTTAYVLDASNKQGKSTASVTVTVIESGEPPEVVTFSADPHAILQGESTTLTWTVGGATQLSLSLDGSPFFSSSDAAYLGRGTLEVWPVRSSTYLLTAENPAGITSAPAFVVVEPDTTIESLSVSRDRITRGEETVVAWVTAGATSIRLEDDGGQVLFERTDEATVASGAFYWAPESDTVLTATATGATGTASASVSAFVFELPVITAFAATPDSITSGGSAVLSWSVENIAQAQVRTLDGSLSTFGPELSNGELPLQPERTTEYWLVAQNEAGASTSASATVYVDKPELDLQVTPGMYPSAGTSVTFSWTSAKLDQVTFSPALPSYEVMPKSFPDIRATGIDLGLSQTLLSSDVALGFSFPIGGRTHSQVTVSIYGYLTFGGAGNQQTTTSGIYAFDTIAALWPQSNGYGANLGGTVHVLADGTAPDRRLVVQWSDVQVWGSTYPKDTFQTVLHENGDVELRSPVWAGPYSRRTGVFPAGVTGVEVQYATSPGVTGNVDARMRADPDLQVNDSRSFWIQGTGDRTYTIQGEGPTGTASDVVSVRYASGGLVVITEIMAEPPTGVDPAAGEWFEVYNPGAFPVSLTGITIRGGVDTGSHTIVGPLEVAAGGYAVLGASANTAVNGGVDVDYVYPRSAELALTVPSDCVDLRYLTTTLDSVCYNEGTGFPTGRGSSLSLRSDSLVASSNDVATAWCLARTPLGTTGGTATPGTANDRCVTGDRCGEEIVLDLSTGHANVAGSTARAQNDTAPAACAPTASRYDLIYRWTLTAPQLVQITADAAAAVPVWLPMIYLYAGTCPDEDAVPVVCGASQGASSSLRLLLPADTYFLVVDSSGGAGSFALDVTAQSAPLLVPTMAPAAYTDIGAMASPLAVADDEAFSNGVPIGFNFPFLGGSFSELAVSSNGFVAMTPLTDAMFVNSELPSVTTPNGVIAVLWDDLVPADDSASVTTRLEGTPGSRRRTIQWSRFDFYDMHTADHRTGATVSFQLVLVEDGTIEMRYGQLLAGGDPLRAAGGGATIGVESVEGLMGTTFSHDTAGLSAGQAITWGAP